MCFLFRPRASFLSLAAQILQSNGLRTLLLRLNRDTINVKLATPQREVSFMNSRRIHWVRVLLGGFFAEAAVFVVVVPVLLKFGQHPLLYLAPVASFVMCFLLALWVGRRLESAFVVHGILVGVVAALIYVAITKAQPEPVAYLIAHALKLLGGAAGGFLAGQRRHTTATLQSAP